MDLVDAIADELRRDIRLERVGRSSLVSMSYSSSDPNLAAAILNALGRSASEDESFLARLSLVERAGFQVVRISVAAEAVPPRTPSLPSAALVLGSSIMLAIAAGLAVVLLCEFKAQQTVLSIEEVSRRGMRALGHVLEDGALARDRTGLGLTATDPARPFFASVTSLQASITTLPGSGREGGKVLLITSALPAEGKSMTAAALAASMAAAGSRVLLLDADLRSPSLHRILYLAQVPGLAESVGSGASLDCAIHRDPATGIHFLPAGKARVHPLAVLGSAHLRDQLELWRRQFDVILIDSPPVLAAGDARLLVPLADHVVVVARWGCTSWGALAQALRLLRDSGACLAGVAVSRVDARALSVYDQAYAQVYGPRSTARISAPKS
jgi:capsular exopolysaccharide synthesis family protein